MIARSSSGKWQAATWPGWWGRSSGSTSLLLGNCAFGQAAEPQKKVALYENLGLALEYEPSKRRVLVEADLGGVRPVRVGGGFEPPRPIRPLGPQPVGARCSACRRVSPSVVPCLDAADLVALVASGGSVFPRSWGNPWGNGLPHELHAVGVAGVHQRLQDHRVSAAGSASSSYNDPPSAGRPLARP
jgi:hypothetical protein